MNALLSNSFQIKYFLSLHVYIYIFIYIYMCGWSVKYRTEKGFLTASTVVQNVKKNKIYSYII